MPEDRICLELETHASPLSALAGEDKAVMPLLTVCTGAENLERPSPATWSCSRARNERHGKCFRRLSSVYSRLLISTLGVRFMYSAYVAIMFSSVPLSLAERTAIRYKDWGMLVTKSSLRSTFSLDVEAPADGRVQWLAVMPLSVRK